MDAAESAQLRPVEALLMQVITRGSGQLPFVLRRVRRRAAATDLVLFDDQSILRAADGHIFGQPTTRRPQGW